jgi:tripartite-type tricarboxylate transporter receptor subunit TctC
MRSTHWITGLALAVCGTNATAQAPKFPIKPVLLVVGFSPGGVTDIVARAIGQGLAEPLGQSVVIENRPGASSQIAGDLVAKSPPDGHVIMMTTQTLMTSVMIERKTFPDIVKDYSQVALAATGILILVTNPSSGEVGEGADRARPCSPRGDQLRLGRRRHHAAPLRRAHGHHGPAEVRPRSLQG